MGLHLTLEDKYTTTISILISQKFDSGFFEESAVGGRTQVKTYQSTFWQCASEMPPAVLNQTEESWTSPGAGISPSDRTDDKSLWIFIVSSTIVALYNASELVAMVFLTFQRYRGLYFYSLLVSGLAIVPYSLGFLLHLLNFTTGNARWFSITLITIGWWPMVTGQAVVLWSRLHLILVGSRGDRIIQWTKWMIVVNVVLLHLPTIGELIIRNVAERSQNLALSA